ncbi:phosphotransferase family protein [Nocardia alba]|uniref:Aminoglycoside phosphotransferase (APT) family kinase protein n=1 Tax=Nocardia alba TaxID=225051 RepID=A0A4R1FNM0_9NOCA|nr:phosphotransferase family protein [Nocardia alba]TCJ96377.1 aminoglycoside phosphotransferase (APT) family kinase protein [Nocardia alba]
MSTPARTDGAREVRTEDAFDTDALTTWIHAALPDHHDLATTPAVRQFSGGASNLTYLLSYPDRDLILRRPPNGRRAEGAHDMAREYRVQTALNPVFDYVPATLALCEDPEVIGTPFYLMQRLDGLIPRKDLPTDLGLTPEQVHTLCTNVLDVLIDLHTIDPTAAQLDWMSKGPGYVTRQIHGWSERYRRAKTWNVGSFDKVMSWLDANQPPDRGAVVIHNDFRFDNIVLDHADPTRPIGLLDWEMATIGDPLMDLGSALAYWVQADDNLAFRFFRRQPTHTPGMLTRHAVVEHYCRRTGIGLTDREWAFYEVFGLFRLAAICQQIYYRYHHKQTTNPAFRSFAIAVLLLQQRCHRIIGTTR